VRARRGTRSVVESRSGIDRIAQRPDRPVAIVGMATLLRTATAERLHSDKPTKSVPGRTQLSVQAPRRAARPELRTASAPHDGQPPRPWPGGPAPGSVRHAWPEQRGADCCAAGCSSDWEGPERDHHSPFEHCHRLSTHRRLPALWKPPESAHSSQALSHAARGRQPHTGVGTHSRPLWEPHHRRGARDLTSRIIEEPESKSQV